MGQTALNHYENGVIYIEKKLDAFDRVFRAAVAWMLLILILHCAGIRIAMVRGRSMQPTLHEGNLVIAVAVDDKSALHRGDVVIFHPSLTNDVIYVKRIVALPGDVVEACGNVLLVNGKDVGLSCIGTGTWEPVTVDDKCIFVLGDNRSHSIDSRIFGAIPIEQVVARVIS